MRLSGGGVKLPPRPSSGALLKDPWRTRSGKGWMGECQGGEQREEQGGGARFGLDPWVCPARISCRVESLEIRAKLVRGAVFAG